MMFLKIRILACKLIQRPKFILEINNGKVTLFSGDVAKNFIRDCTDIFKRNRLKSGFVYGVKGDHGSTRVKGSSELSDELLQRVKNIYGFYA